MGKSYRPYFPDEELLLPPSLRDWLPENHLAYFVSDVVDNLDLSAMDAVYGDEKRGQPPYDPQSDELPAELQRRETRRKKIREAKRALEARAREKAAAEGADPKQARPKEKDQYNFTDPESRIMKGADGFVQGYNAQAAVEPDLQLIVGQTVTAATNDKEQLLPMMG